MINYNTVIYFRKIISEAIMSYFVSCNGKTLSGSGKVRFTELDTYTYCYAQTTNSEQTKALNFAPLINLP